MNPPKGFLIGSFLLWLILLALSQSLHADYDGRIPFGYTMADSDDSWGFTVVQNGSGGAIRGWCDSTNSKETSAGVWGYGFSCPGVYGFGMASYGVQGHSAESIGVRGTTDADSYGVAGESTTGGVGVGGYAETGTGVYGKSEGEGLTGVWGLNSNSKGGFGVYGMAVNGAGVFGAGGQYGVFGLSHSLDHAAGYFENDAQGYGVYAETNSPQSATRPALAGLNRGSGHGLQGQSKQGTGVAGKGLTRGVHGVATSTKTKGTGVYGSASGTAGVGIEGSCNKGKGIQGTTVTGAGVYGVATEKGWAGKFQGYKDASGVLITTNGGPGLIVSGGSKSAVVPTSQGSRLLYAEEATEVYFTDYGSGRLTDGKAVIPVDPLFAETVNLGQPYHVFVQSYSDAQLVVSRRSPREFEVRLHARDTEGDRNAEFSYRLVAKRKGFEQARLEESPSADNADKRMDAAVPGVSEMQAFLSGSESADVFDAPPPPQPSSRLRQNALSWPSIGTGK